VTVSNNKSVPSSCRIRKLQLTGEGLPTPGLLSGILSTVFSVAITQHALQVNRTTNIANNIVILLAIVELLNLARLISSASSGLYCSDQFCCTNSNFIFLDPFKETETSRSLDNFLLRRTHRRTVLCFFATFHFPSFR
jgi:hypothetical protein